MSLERVQKKGGRYYRRKAPKEPVIKLSPLVVPLLSAVFESNSESPSVTTILSALPKPALVNWAALEERKMITALAGEIYEQLQATALVDKKTFMELVLDQAGKGAHKKLLRKAADIGSEVHARIEWEFKGELGKERESEAPSLNSPQAKRSFTRFQEWREQVKLELVDTEKYLFSSLYGWGGTLDTIGKVNDRLAILDFKTGKHVYEEYFLQIIAYKLALMEEGIEALDGYIVRLPKYEDDPEFEVVQVPDDPDLATTFLALKVVHKWIAKNNEAYKKKKKAATKTAEVDTPKKA